MMSKKSYFRCTICGDYHYGLREPTICPTCGSNNAYISVTEQEADIVLFEKQCRRGKNEWRPEEFLGVIREFASRNDFTLNPDLEHVSFTIEGILRNERSKGLKYCPCRVPSGIFEADLELICPCNFKAQETWAEQGRCWCGLFVDPRRYSKD
jgi:ferredoxin-thioredoxin reductase catalytic subunit